MGKKFALKKSDLPLIFCLVGFVLALFISCSTAQTTQEKKLADAQTPVITKIELSSADQETVVKLICTKPALFSAFPLANPDRIILDVSAEPGPELSSKMMIHKDRIEQIQIQRGENQAFSTRMVLVLQEPLEYRTESADNGIRLILKHKLAAASQGQAKEEPPAAIFPPQSEATTASTSKPRIFFQPKATDLTQVLGIDFTMLEQGKSRLIITTDKKCAYDLKQQGTKTLLLKLGKTTIPDLLKRHLDSRHFEGVVDQVKASYVPAEKQVAVVIALREMVPFHIDQDDNEIDIDFSRTAVKPPEQKIVPLQVSEIRNQSETGAIVEEKSLTSSQNETAFKAEPPISSVSAASKTETSANEPDAEVTSEQPSQQIPGLKKRYRGEPMTMDFVNADVTNILKLISEVSNLNIVWGPEVQGTVSMRLKNVPWDQALDLILANNNLSKREAGNVIWITTSAKMAQYEADERKRREEIDEEVKRKYEAKKKQEDLEPLVTNYLPLDFASTKDLKPHLDAIKTTRGKISEDERTNTIVITDVSEVQKKAKQIIKQFDVPVKQIMIEARIVDATEEFNRSLGIQWTDHTKAYRANKANGTITVPPSAFAGDVDDPLNTGGQLVYGGAFSTNIPDKNWKSNIGLTVARLTGSGLGALTLDAALALSEMEGTSKTISAPKVMAREGTEAVIKRGETLIYETSTSDKTDSKEIEALLSLYVTPVKVTYNDFIILKVKVTDDIPITLWRISRKNVETDLMVKTGDTIVIGGIYKEEGSNSESGIPFLRRIPILGYFFKANYKSTKKSELLVFITPSVVQTELKK